MAADLASLLRDNRDTIVQQWMEELRDGAAALRGRVSFEELGRTARDFLDLLIAAQAAGTVDAKATELDRFFSDFSRDRVMQGFGSDETAQFLFSLKKPVF